MLKHDNYAAVLGSLHLDYILEIPYLPAKGETLKGDNLKVIPGGKGGNQAYYLALQGVCTYMLGMVGVDSMSAPLVDSLVEVGVDCEYLARNSAAASGMSVAMVTQDKDYSAVIHSGVNLCIDKEYIYSVKDIIQKAGALVMQYEIPLSSVLYAAKLAAQSKTKVILNAAPMYDTPDILKYVDILIVNEVEAGMIAGKEIDSIESAGDVTRQLNINIPSVITTLGSKGLVYAADGNDPEFIPAYKVDVVDSHGAGDSFVGAFAARIVKGSSLKSAIEYAVCVAAISVQNKGPKTLNVTEAAVEQFKNNFCD